MGSIGKLTKRFIKAAAPNDKAYILWDGDIPGFGVRVHRSGRKAFVRQYRIGRRSRTMSLGYTQVITPDTARGFGWFDPALPFGHPRQRHRHLCSIACQDLCHRRRGMIDPTPNEKAAFVRGGQMGGEYLDSIGKTDLETLQPEEWLTFVEVVVSGYGDHLRDLAERDAQHLRRLDPQEVPF